MPSKNESQSQSNSTSKDIGGIIVKNPDGKDNTYVIEGNSGFAVIDLSTQKEVEEKISAISIKLAILETKVKDLEKWKWWFIYGVFLSVVLFILNIILDIIKS